MVWLLEEVKADIVDVQKCRVGQMCVVGVCRSRGDFFRDCVCGFFLTKKKITKRLKKIDSRGQVKDK